MSLAMEVCVSMCMRICVYMRRGNRLLSIGGEEGGARA